MLRAGEGGTEPLENLEKLKRDPTEASFQITPRIKGGKFTENVPKPLRSQTPKSKRPGAGGSSSPAFCLQTGRLAAQARGPLYWEYLQRKVENPDSTMTKALADSERPLGASKRAQNFPNTSPLNMGTNNMQQVLFLCPLDR